MTTELINWNGNKIIVGNSVVVVVVYFDWQEVFSFHTVAMASPTAASSTNTNLERKIVAESGKILKASSQIIIILDFPPCLFFFSPLLEMCLDSITTPLFGGHDNHHPLGV